MSQNRADEVCGVHHCWNQRRDHLALPQRSMDADRSMAATARPESADDRSSYGYMTVMHELAANGKAVEADLVDLRENALVGNRVLQ